MPRRNNGPRLRFLEKRGCYYIVWSESGRSKERSTGTADRRDAEIALADFIRRQPGRVGPKDPSEIYVTDVLAEYALDRSPDVQAPLRIAYAIAPLAEFFASRTVQEVTKQTCKGYSTFRNRAPGTVRRDLGVLRAAINHAHREGKLTRPVPVDLPERPPARTRWLTREEAARLLKAAIRLHLMQFPLLSMLDSSKP